MIRTVQSNRRKNMAPFLAKACYRHAVTNGNTQLRVSAVCIRRSATSGLLTAVTVVWKPGLKKHKHKKFGKREREKTKESRNVLLLFHRTFGIPFSFPSLFKFILFVLIVVSQV